MGVFLGFSDEALLWSSDFFLRINGRWYDIIIGFYVLSESVWLPKRHVLGGEKVFHPKDLIFVKEPLEASSRTLGWWCEQVVPS